MTEAEAELGPGVQQGKLPEEEKAEIKLSNRSRGNRAKKLPEAATELEIDPTSSSSTYTCSQKCCFHFLGLSNRIQWTQVKMPASGQALSGHNNQWLLYPAVFYFLCGF